MAYNYTYTNATDQTVSTALTGTLGLYKSGAGNLFLTGSTSGLSGVVDHIANSGLLIFQPSGATATTLGSATTINVGVNSVTLSRPATANQVNTFNGNFAGAGGFAHQGDVGGATPATTTLTGSLSALSFIRVYGVGGTINAVSVPQNKIVYDPLNVTSGTVNFTLSSVVNSSVAIEFGSVVTPASSSEVFLNVNGAGALVTSGGLTRTDSSSASTRTVKLGGTATGNQINGSGASSSAVKTPIWKLGTGSWSLGGNNDPLIAGVLIDNGTLKLTNSAALGNTSDAVLMQPTTPPTLELSGGIALPLAKPINPGSGTIRSSAGANTIAGDITLAGTTAIDVTADSLTLSGLITSSGQFNKTGTGLATLTNTANGFTSSPTISAGTLAIPAIAALGAGSGLTLSGSGVLRYTGSTGGTLSRTLTGSSLSSGGFESTGAGSLVVTGSGSLSGTIKLGAASSSAQYNTLSATISSGGFTKEGDGRWIVTSVNNLSGATTVSAGTLMAAPSAVDTAAKLLGGNVTVAAGGKIQISSDNSQLGRNRYSDLTFAGTSGNPARIRIGGSAVSPTVQMNGNLTISGSVTWKLTADVFKTPGTYRLVEFVSGALVGSLNDVTVELPTGRSVAPGGFVYDGASSPKTITITVV